MDGLHIYPQCHEHDQAYICGTHAALKELRDALSRALEKNSAAKAACIGNDGAGYFVLIAPVDPDTFARMTEPYSDPRHDLLSDEPPRFGPWNLAFDWRAA